MNQKDTEFVRNTLEYALSQINRGGCVSDEILANLKVAVSKLEQKPEFVEDHPAHRQ
jgi:hypothetical protein